MTTPVSSADWFRDHDAVMAAMRAEGSLREVGGVRFGKYEALVELARGSHSAILLGRHARTGRRVAIKLLRGGEWISDEIRRRFDREIELVRSLEHPHIVEVLDHGTSADGAPFLVMAYVEGVPLDEVQVQARDALRLIITICDAVSHAHQRGIIHRDLKPSNIRVDAQGCPHVLDFGLARLLGPAAARGASHDTLTITSQFLGTPAYAAPEQFLRQPHEVDTRADVYALGVILYQMLVGRLPYRDGASIGGLIRNITGNEIAAPDTDRSSGISADLRAVMLKALAGEPEDRYQTVNSLADDLRAVLDGRPTTARVPTRREQLWRAVRRHRAISGLIAIVVLVSLAFAATTSVMALQIDRARRAAVAAEERARADAEHSQAVLEFLTGMIFHSHTASDDPERAAARRVLDRAQERLAGRPPEVEAVRAELHRILGMSYYSVVAFDPAIEHLRAALAGDGFDDQPARRLHIQALLGTILLEQERVAEAEQVIDRLLAERADGEPLSINQYVATTMFDIARRLRAQGGDPDRATALLREAWSSSAVEADPHPVHVAIAADLAEALLLRDEPREAAALLERAVALSTRIHGPDHPRTLEARRRLEQVRRGS